MVWHFGDPFVQPDVHSIAPVLHPRSFIYGQVNTFKTIASTGKIGMLVAVLQPYGAFSLLGIPAHELTDLVVPLKDIGFENASLLEEQIDGARDNLTRVQLVERAFMKQLSGVHTMDSIVQQAVNLIYDSNGLTTIKHLIERLAVPERQLERRFHQNIGISPKQFSNAIRLQHFIKQVRYFGQKENLTNIIYDLGYYDQAHLNRTFKKTTGVTPRQYLFHSNLLAANFLQLNSL
jgi:AraC-like DNA-binding protein